MVVRSDDNRLENSRSDNNGLSSTLNNGLNNNVSRLSTASSNDSLDHLLADRRFCTLCDMMKIQAVALVLYGFIFFVAPSLLLIPQFGFTDSIPAFWLRALGGVLVLAGVLELRIIRRLRKQTSRIWVFMVMPLIFIACTGIERVMGNYQSISLFLWVFELSMLLLCAVTFISFLRLRNDAVNAGTELMHVTADKAKLEAIRMKKLEAKKQRRAEQAKQEKLHEQERLHEQRLHEQEMRQLTKTDPSLSI